MSQEFDFAAVMREQELQNARGYWQMAEHNAELQAAGGYISLMDLRLRNANATRADIGVTDDMVRAVERRGAIGEAKSTWKRIKRYARRGYFPIVEARKMIQWMDEHLAHAGQTRSDIGVTDAEVAEILRQAQK